MYTYLLIATENEISQMSSIFDVFSQIERTEPLVGGISLEALTSLSKIFLDGETRAPLPTQYSLKDESRFYKIDIDLCEKIAIANHESILDASVPWRGSTISLFESELWKGKEINEMDLAGLLMDIAALCKQTDSETSLFVLLSNED